MHAVEPRYSELGQPRKKSPPASWSVGVHRVGD